MDKCDISVLLLGHNGMLGSMIKKFLISKGINVVTTNYKWPDFDFKQFILKSKSKFLINCIASIPQKVFNLDHFNIINFELPKFISENYGGHIIHPSSDCERCSNLDYLGTRNNNYYYILSKLKAFNLLSKIGNCSVIRTSIIGPEIKTHNSLWSWFEDNPNIDVYGYTNHMWSGITTLEFSKICLNIINDSSYKTVLDVSTDEISKFNLLKILNCKLTLNKNVIATESNNQNFNFYTRSVVHVPSIEFQIEELVKFNKQ